MRSIVFGAAVAVAVLADPTRARADDPDGTYLLPHPDADWWLSGQANAILQAQPGFHSPYEDTNSFKSGDHAALSFVGTVFAGYQVWKYTALVVDGESAGGDGLSAALGIAGFTNLDVVRNPSLGPTPYLARAYIDQVIPLSDDHVRADRSPQHVLRTLPSKRIEIRAGKLSTVDYFDANSSGTDSHLQFMNWAIDNNGAYDYAADTRGYTLGAVVELVMPRWAARFGELLMPTVANGIHYDYDIAHARGENLELEGHGCIAGHPGILRLLGFLNHAAMGSYARADSDAKAAMEIGETLIPDITASRLAGRIKYGFGINVEQEITPAIHAFARIGWNDGATESFAYTEIDNTVLVGADVKGSLWHRDNDKVGAAFVTNGLSSLHSEYLALGGMGFLLGDGKLNYSREDITEAYYTFHAYRGISPAVDVQFIEHPGYNADRGPVVVGSVRLHVEL